MHRIRMCADPHDSQIIRLRQKDDRIHLSRAAKNIIVQRMWYWMVLRYWFAVDSTYRTIRSAALTNCNSFLENMNFSATRIGIIINKPKGKAKAKELCFIAQSKPRQSSCKRKPSWDLGRFFLINLNRRLSTMINDSETYIELTWITV